MATTTTNYGFTKPGVNDPADANIWGTQTNNNWDLLDTDLKAVSDVANSGAPALADYKWSASSDPQSFWVLCDHSAIDRTTYAALFAKIGTTYGAGNGTTTFNVPDLRGRGLFGVDNMGGIAVNRITSAISGITGSAIGSTGGDQVPSAHTITSVVTDPGHRHQLSDAQGNSFNQWTGVAGTPKSFQTSQSTNSGSVALGVSATTGVTVASTDNATGTGANMPPTMMGYIFIYAGV